MKLATMAALIALFTLTACVPQATQPTASPATSPTIEAMTTDQDQVVTEGQVTRIPVEGNNFTFDVEEIEVKQGEKVIVAFTSNEGFHDFVIDELGVNTGMVPSGQTVEVEIPTDKPGTYSFYCSVGEHRQQGMEGTLIIE